MKKTFLSAIMAFMILALAGCGDGGRHTPTFVSNILSDQAFDGDILKDPNTGAFSVTQGGTIQSVFAGIDPATGAESRAFLVFPLNGVNGVPANAIIESAFLDIEINSITLQSPNGTIPVRIDLVSFQQPMIGSDFDRTLQPALATTTILPPISQADFGNHVTVDVTSLMVEAQNLGLPSFQVRILEDLGIVLPGLIEINDTTGANRSGLAPLLRVRYF